MVGTPAHFESFIWPRPNAGQIVKMTVLLLRQILDPDAVTYFPKFFGLRLGKFYFVFFMDCRKLLMDLLTLTSQT